MTILRPIGVKGSCGHKFTIIFPTSLYYYINPEFLQNLVSGNKTHHECAVCHERVTIYFELVVDIIGERILLHPEEWKNTRDVGKNLRSNEIIIYDDFDSHFPNLISYLKKKKIIITDYLTLAEEYIPNSIGDQMSSELGTWRPHKK